MTVEYLVFFHKQLIGVVSQRTDSRYLVRSIHQSRRTLFYNRQQATRWVKAMHALASGHWKGILKVALPDSEALYAAYRTLADDAYLYIPIEQAFDLGDKVLLELEQANKRYYLVARIIWCNSEPSEELPAGVGLESVSSEQLNKRMEMP